MTPEDEWWAKYAEYLKSDHWKKTRVKVLKRDHFECRICGRKSHLQVHHKSGTYFRLGHERLDDLSTLCDLCHEGITQMLRYRRGKAGVEMPEFMQETPAERVFQPDEGETIGSTIYQSPLERVQGWLSR